MIGAQASMEQLEKIRSYLIIGKEEGAKVYCGGDVSQMDGELDGGYSSFPSLPSSPRRPS
jgi:aldehyde dehydrogenase